MSILPDLSEMVFEDLKPVEVPVRVHGRKYLLREASEGAYSEYRNFMARNVKLGEAADGTTRVTSAENVFDAVTVLLGGCLFGPLDERGGPPEQPVGRAFVQGLPRRVTEPLFDRARQISNIDQPADPDKLEEQGRKLLERASALRRNGEPADGGRAAKNLLGATPTTSG